MHLTYQLTAEDLLAYHLHLASQDPNQQAASVRNRFLPPALWAILGIFLFPHGLLAPAILLAMALIWVLIHPALTRVRLLRGFRHHIHHSFQDTLNHPTTLELRDDGLFSSTAAGEATTPVAEISSITELDTVFLIGLQPPMCHVLPKNSIPAQILAPFIAALAARTSLPVSDQRPALPNQTP